MIDVFFDKLYRHDRLSEPCYIGIPVKEGELKSLDTVALYQNGAAVPIQKKITSLHKDGTVRFLFLRFLADLPANKKAVLQCDLHASGVEEWTGPKVRVTENGADSGKEKCVENSDKWETSGEITVDTGELSFRVRNQSDSIFEELQVQGRRYAKEQFAGPFLKDGEGRSYEVRVGDWRVMESGPVCAILKAKGSNVCADSSAPDIEFELKLTAWAGKPWVEVSYRIINTCEEPLHVASLVFQLLRDSKVRMSETLTPMNVVEILDSTGCGDVLKDSGTGNDSIFHARGINGLEEFEKKAPVDRVRTCVGSSNYKTDFYIGREGAEVNRVVDSKYLMREANEHFAEVLYGTFFADWTDAQGGVCATIFQAQQNYPKAVVANGDGLAVMLVPEGVEKVVMQPGMSREQRFLLHFHEAEESLEEIDNRSLIYQMPDRPYLEPEVHRASGVWLNVFADKWDIDVEQHLIAQADGHCRAYGMLNFGDSYDGGYTAQGRGGGDLVWCNNEYDYPHACALLYVRTGIRRFLDYNIASCSHWMDVDVCHYHPNPLYVGGQWEHTSGHTKNGVMVCSHEWVEGLLDYYHFTGDDRGLETALGIGENVLRLLDTPMYAQVGEANARETGWALRTLVALYVETRDEKWIGKCKSITNDFKVWEEQYGNWLAPYTDNTVIRVGFMISVALGSLMRYYREFPDEELKALMLRAVDDLIENCYVEKWGCFYYKELPSLNRLGNNTLLLEALVIAYELSGNADYLKPGVETFRRVVRNKAPGVGGAKSIHGDAVVVGNGSSKGFAQSFIPLSTYYRVASETGIL